MGTRQISDSLVTSGEGRGDRPWTDDELGACVLAYRTLWLAEQDGEHPNKAALRRATLADGLRGRAKGAYEFRMQNVSALLDELGIPFVRGYLPRRHVGALKPRLIAMINDVWFRFDTYELPTSDPEALETRVSAAWAKIRSGRGLPPAGVIEVVRSSEITTRFVRDPNVIAWVLARAERHCEACEAAAPFKRVDGTPYLEVHHVRPLAEGGPDVVANAIAACPNCHRRLHYGVDRLDFRRALLSRLPEL